MTSMRDHVFSMTSGGTPLPAFDRLLGFTLTRLEEGRAVFEGVADERHFNPGHRVHGAFMTGLADSAMGFAYSSTLGPGESCTNLDVAIKFLRPVWKGRLKAEARVLKRGRRVGLATCDVTDEDGRLVARAESTFMSMPSDEAAERPPGA